jgi:alkaline phosphatase D
MIGPDSVSKNDNHTSKKGFRYERDHFFDWLKENGIGPKQIFILNGDRHWQYHSIHPSGFEEFSKSTLVDGNAVKGNFPGDPKSTDPNGEIVQPYHPQQASGGFLLVKVEGQTIDFEFYDENGKLNYEVSRIAKEKN